MFRSFLSPIFGYSDFAFRLQCQKHGADAACVPLINCEAIARDASKVSSIDACPQERNLGVQLAGNDPDTIGRTVRLISDSIPSLSWLNLNCGCPSKRMVGCGVGSAMLGKPERIADAIAAMRRNSDCPVSVKLRLKDSRQETVALCRMLEEAGADFIIVHGRRPEQGYSGRCDWGMIRSVKERLSVPVVGNGDIRDSAEGRRLVDDGWCDSFMIGRAAVTDPAVFAGEGTQGREGRFRLLEEYISIHRRYSGEPPLKDVKAKALNYLRGTRDAASLRRRISLASSIEEITALR